jgi:predicted house-cleaning noncanonical NTP pyrophosphatase (MazG superfamily)
MKKRLLIEEDIDEIEDFRKILLLNKKKLDYRNVMFLDEHRNDFDGIIEVTAHGLLFHFDDLEQFLKFFFQETYKEGSDSEWEAVNYDRMYYGQWDFYSECQDRAYDDWSEGYTLGYFCDSAILKLKQLAEFLDPSTSKDFIRRNNGRMTYDGGGDLPTILDKFFPGLGDQIDEIVCMGKDRAVSSGAQELIEETYCNGLKQFGIENWGKSVLTNCFRTYFISWGNLVQMYIDTSDFEEPLLDTMFRVIERGFSNHPPEYYEIEYNVWDNEIFESETCQKLEDLMDEYIEKAHEEINSDYIEVMKKIGNLGLFNFTQLPDKKHYLKVEKVDPETLKVTFRVGTSRQNWNSKMGVSDVDSVIAMATQPGLFDPTEYRIS